MEWKTALTEVAEKIMIQGGELKFIVAKRGNERVPLIYSFPDNCIRCDVEKLID